MNLVIKSTLWILLVLAAFPLPSVSQGTKSEQADINALMQRVEKRWTGDLNEALAHRRLIRVLVSYSDTNFFVTKGTKRGLEFELMSEYENFLNRRKPRPRIKTQLVFMALPFERLIPALRKGQGDVVAAGLTITPQREKQVSFSAPYIRDVKEIIVASKNVKGLKKLSDLAGRTVYVVSGSSYLQHLNRLNAKFVKRGLKPVEIARADKNLEAEDILQMINAGIYDLTVVDHHIAELWAKVLKDLVLRKDLVVNSGGQIAWAVRKENPQLLASLNRYVKKHRQGTLLGNILIERYYENTRWISNPVSVVEQKKINNLKALFKKYAKKYDFNWIQIGAIAYQESGFSQNKKSAAGAIGIMQVRPQTAADPKINIAGIHKTENNIHAGVKYLAFLRDRYFSAPQFSPEARVDFTIAAYNAGPARINGLRRKSRKQGLDPNRWFFNVEHVARRVIGRETVQYVANINKYFIAFKTAEQIREKRMPEAGNFKP
jgi:membrane-bound lytic murein transglycosylase MltF